MGGTEHNLFPHYRSTTTGPCGPVLTGPQVPYVDFWSSGPVYVNLRMWTTGPHIKRYSEKKCGPLDLYVDDSFTQSPQVHLYTGPQETRNQKGRQDFLNTVNLQTYKEDDNEQIYSTHNTIIIQGIHTGSLLAKVTVILRLAICFHLPFPPISKAPRPAAAGFPPSAILPRADTRILQSVSR